MSEDNMAILSFVLGLIGTITGCIGTYLSIEARRQHLTITRSHTRDIGFTITNHTLRPIPIESVKLFIKKGGDKYIPAGSIELTGFSPPGLLPPESSFEASFLNMEQAIEAVMSDEYRLELRTQTGKIFRSKSERI